MPSRSAANSCGGGASGEISTLFIEACRRNEGRGRGHKVAHLAADRDARQHDFGHGLDRRRCTP